MSLAGLERFDGADRETCTEGQKPVGNVAQREPQFVSRLRGLKGEASLRLVDEFNGDLRGRIDPPTGVEHLFHLDGIGGLDLVDVLSAGTRASCELEAEFAEMNGYEAESEAAVLLNGLMVSSGGTVAPFFQPSEIYTELTRARGMMALVLLILVGMLMQYTRRPELWRLRCALRS